MPYTCHTEMRLLGVNISVKIVLAPEGNGCTGQVIRWLSGNLLWARSVDTIEQFRLVLLALCDTSNATLLIQRLGYGILSHVRTQFSAFTIAM